MRIDLLIVGGGLSGLALAATLSREGRELLLVEARSRLGGRILSETKDDGYFDLGPAWFWPGQPRIDALIRELGLQRFDQFSNGDLLFEDERGRVQRGHGFSSMEGSYRLEGGLGALVSALAATVPAGRLCLNAEIKGLSRSHDWIIAKFENGSEISARQVVLALPPRVASKIAYEPTLPEKTIRVMKNIPTWMAGQAKAVAVYDRPFWREAGLSGDAMSRYGPMVEIHDASPMKGGPYALFGFIGVAPEGRRDEQRLRESVIAQLTRLFGVDAANPQALYLKDWAFDRFTATEDDLKPLYAHPHYGLSSELSNLWDRQLILSGTETASQFGGYLEGALEAAENTFTLLQRVRGLAE